MLLMKECLKLDADGDWRSKNVVICGKGISNLFDIPGKIQTIWISLHDEYASNRIEGEVTTAETIFPVLELEYEEGFSNKYIDEILTKHMDKLLYVEVEYMW